MAKIEKKTNRRLSRETAFIILFEQTVTNEEVKTIIENAEEARDIDVSDDYVTYLANGTVDNEEDIDALLKKHIKGWTIHRLSKVALTVLRLAAFELKFESDQAVSITINEAVELAKKYGEKTDASFVNGVLSSVARELNRE